MAAYQTYAVKAGDTLSRIASANGVTVGELVALNGLADPDWIAIGQMLNIRRSGDSHYAVERGDTLSTLAAHFGVTVPALAEANGLAPPYLLQIGQELSIPAGSASGQAVTPATPAASGELPQPGKASRKAAEIARQSVLPRSAGRCYKYVKRALLNAGAVDHYLGGVSAIEAGPLLVQQGFVDILGNPAAKIKSPYDAPVGAVIVYRATSFATDKNRIHGHIEIRTADGFASDYFSPRARTGPKANGLVLNSASGRAVAGIYVKPDGAAAQTPKTAPAPAPAASPAPAAVPSADAADVYAIDNLKLDPTNGKYRAFIAEAAQRTAMAPQTVAAIIDAEAAKVRGTRQWDANSKSPSSSACGLTQFLKATWLGEATRDGGLLNVEAKADGCVDAANKVVDQAQLLALRFDPRISILAGADFAVANLKALDKQHVLPAGLDPAGRAKLAYLAHHEGAVSAIKFLRGEMKYIKEGQFNANVPVAQRGALVAKHGSMGTAYRAYLADYIDSRIDVTRFMVSAEGVEVKALKSYFA